MSTRSLWEFVQVRKLRLPARWAISFSLLVCVPLGVVELVLRCVDRHEFNADAQGVAARAGRGPMASSDPDLIYVARPNNVNKDGIKLTERHGINRTTDYEERRPAGVRRVIALGDSVSAGLGLRINSGVDPFPNLIESVLGQGYEVLNFGTDGYGTLQEGRLLEVTADLFQPDLVLLQYCLNDTAVSLTPTAWFLERPVSSSAIFDRVMAIQGMTLGGRSRFDPRIRLNAPMSGPVLGNSELRAFWQDLYRKDGEGWQLVVEGLARIRAKTAAIGVEVIMVVFPLLQEGLDEGLLDQIHRQVAQEGRAQGFTTIDLRDEFGRYSLPALRQGGDAIHPGPLGHRIAAEVLVPVIKQHLDARRS